MKEDKSVPVWTLLQGTTPVSKEFGIIRCVEGRSECAVRGDDRFCVFDIPHGKLFEYYHVLVFVGLIPQCGVSKRVLRLTQRDFSGSPFEKFTAGVSAPKGTGSREVGKKAPSDFSCEAFSDLQRFISGGILAQMVHRSVLAFPKGDERGTIITFRDRSLEPQFRFVRSIPKELVVESASSY